MSSRRKLRKSGRNLRDATKDLTAALAILVPTGMAYAQTPAPPPATQGTPAAAEGAAPAEASVLSDLVVNASAIPSIASEAVGGGGFAKPLLETPRAVSLINEDTLNLLGINAIEDIVRAVPGTYTTTRYGLQGGINVRGIPADVYWRGMKRITAQGHYRTDLSSLSSMEIVKGAAPPIYGLGRIGGYVNQTPRSGGKAQNGTYLSDLSGFVQGVTGSFEKLEATTGVGGPVDVAGKQGGFYTYGLVENSGTYVRQVNVRQRLLQSAISLNNVGMFRVESGFQAQNSQTSGGYMNRVTQGLIDNGTYVRGSPLVNLDAGAGANLDGAGDGFVGQREQHANSPVTGTVTSANRPLDQRFNWPKCSGTGAAAGADPKFAGPGGWCLPGHFPVQAGIPDSLYNYLVANPNKDPTGAVRAAHDQGTGVTPASGSLPVGFFLDPTTTGLAEVDYRRNGSYERLQNANVGLAWFDLVYDTNPDFTMKIQTFSDNLDTYKDSYLPYGEKQGIHRFEEKFTVTRRLPEKWLPGWVDVNTLSSISYRRTGGYIRSSSGDFDYRQDVLRGDPQYGDGQHYPNTKFANQLNDPSFLTGAPAENERRSVYDEFGAGFMFDFTFLKNTSLTIGGRWDGSTARDIEYAHNNQQKPSASNSCNLPGNALAAPTSEDIANSETQLQVLTSGRCDYGPAWDDGKTWSISLSQQLPFGVRPYFTIADASVILDASNNIVQNTVVTAPGGHIGRSKLTEAGIKGDWFRGKLFASVAMYRQLRSDVSNASDPTAGADSSATKTRGLEMQIDANPTRKFHIGFYAVGQHQKYVFNTNSQLQLTGRQLGFQDILGADGSVLYPAEAFVYGGRVQLVLPAELGQIYLDRVGEPRYQAGVNIDYKLPAGFGVHVDGQRFSSFYLDRTKTVELPMSFTMNTGFTYDHNRIHLKLSGFNVLDKRYFRAGTGDTNVNLVSVMPGTAIQFQAKLDY